MKKFWFLNFVNFIENIIIVILIVVPLRVFLFEPFFVLGNSMEPAYHPFDYLIIDKLTYKFRSPHRGEVIVFHPPFDEKVYYIKRLIGLPGELVEVRNGYVYINGEKLNESYLKENIYTPGEAKYYLGKDEYFVLGDNREQSFDSRKWGPVPKSRIIGKVLLHISLVDNLFRYLR